MNVLLSPQPPFFPHQHEANRLSPSRSRKLYLSYPSHIPPSADLGMQNHHTTCLPESERPTTIAMRCLSLPAALQPRLRDTLRDPQRKSERQTIWLGGRFHSRGFSRHSIPRSSEAFYRRSASATQILATRLPAVPQGLHTSRRCRCSATIKTSSVRHCRTANQVPITHTIGSSSR